MGPNETTMAESREEVMGTSKKMYNLFMGLYLHLFEILIMCNFKFFNTPQFPQLNLMHLGMNWICKQQLEEVSYPLSFELKALE